MLLTHVAKIIVVTAIVIVCAEQSFAREWRGIVPLHSTRADVIRLLNQCSDQREACRFTLGTDDVHILFSGGLRAEDRECASALPPETVMFIAVRPRAKLKLRDLGLDKRHSQHFNASDPPARDYPGYRSDDGLMVSLFKDKVVQIFYLPTAVDADRCKDYYSRAESFIRIVIVHVPLIYKLEAQETIKAGEKLRVSAYSDINETLGYEWNVSAGKIIAGQYTKEVTIDTTGLAGQTLVVTAEIGDPFFHAAASSCHVRVLPE